MPLFKKRTPKVTEEAELSKDDASIEFLDMTVLRKNNITRLTIDERWTKLFVGIPISPELEKIQNEMNELIKKEAMLKNEQENLEPSKKKCMNQIISLTKEAFENNNKEAKVKLTEYKEEIERINGRFDKIMEEIELVTDELKEVNLKLLKETTLYVFTALKNNKDKAQGIREELIQLQAKEKALTEELESINLDWTSYAVYFTELLGSESVQQLEDKFGLEELKKSEAPDTPSNESN